MRRKPAQQCDDRAHPSLLILVLMVQQQVIMNAQSQPAVTVIVSTYNSPVHLLNTLAGFAVQTARLAELIIADDGSTDDTREHVEKFCRTAPFTVRHFWQPDEGFRKPAILNKAIDGADGNYILFTDGDCIPRSDFVAMHMAKATPGNFLSGGVEYLSAAATARLGKEEIIAQKIFEPAWLNANRERPRLIGKVNASRLMIAFARRLTTTRASFNGHNTSAWRDDIVAVNGFDERMTYGGLDRELGERLNNYGVKGLSVRYDAIAVHQHHFRPYATSAGWRANDLIRQETRRNRSVWTDSGLRSHGVSKRQRN